MEIDRRLTFLGKRLDVLTVVSEPPPEDGKVYFGSFVTLEDEEGAKVTYRLVGPDETDTDRGFISIESPLARALRGRLEGDEVEVVRPRGTTVYEIVRVESATPEEDRGR
jgi:transcription elongation factor GreB